jgi:DNA modification methylase
MQRMNKVLQGDCLEMLKTLAECSVQCCVTSPPYWGLRDYGVAGQLGLEPTPEEYVAKMVEVFREVRRVLREDGTCWVNLGDSYARDFAKGGSGPNGKHDYIPAYGDARKEMRRGSGRADGIVTDESPRNRDGTFVNNSAWPLKPKDLVGIPWRLAFALQSDGWWLRQDIIWHKPNPMPESVTDRCTKAHEYLFLLTKSARYYYDAEAIQEPSVCDRMRGPHSDSKCPNGGDNSGLSRRETEAFRNKRSVWTVTTMGYAEAHFATFPPDLIKPCILAGSKPGDTILDPFGGSGTTGMVALELGRKAILIELNPEYVKLIHRRCHVTPGLALA